MAKRTPSRIKKLVAKVKEYGGYNGLGGMQTAGRPKAAYSSSRSARAYNIRQNRKVARAVSPNTRGVALSKLGNNMR